MVETDRRVQVLANARCLYSPDIEVITFGFTSKKGRKRTYYQAAVMKRQNYNSAWVNILFSDPPAPTRKKAMQLLLEKTEDELVKHLTEKGVGFPLVADVAGFEVSTVEREDVVSVSEWSEASDFEFIATPASSSDGELVDNEVPDEEDEPSQTQAEFKSESPESGTVEDAAIPTGNHYHGLSNSSQAPPDPFFSPGWTTPMAKIEECPTNNAVAKPASAEETINCVATQEKMEVKPSKLDEKETVTTLPQLLPTPTGASKGAPNGHLQLIKEDPFKSLDSWGGGWSHPVKLNDAKQVAFNFSKEPVEKFDGSPSTSQEKPKNDSHDTPKILPGPEVGLDDYDWSQWEKSKKKKTKNKKNTWTEDTSFPQWPTLTSSTKVVEASPENVFPIPKRINGVESGSVEPDNQGEKFYEAPEHHLESDNRVQTKSDAAGDPWDFTATGYNTIWKDIDNHQVSETKPEISPWPYLEPENSSPPLKTTTEQTPNSTSDIWGSDVSKDQERIEKSKVTASKVSENSPASPQEPAKSDSKAKANPANDFSDWDAIFGVKGKGKERPSDSSSPSNAFALGTVREDVAATQSSRNESDFGKVTFKKHSKSEEAITSNEDFEWRKFQGRSFEGEATINVDRNNVMGSGISTTYLPASASVPAKAQANYQTDFFGNVVSDPEEARHGSSAQAVPSFVPAAPPALQSRPRSMGASNTPRIRLVLLTMQHKTPSSNESFRMMLTIPSFLRKAVIDEASRYMASLCPLATAYYDRTIEVVSAKGPDGDIDLTMLDEESWREIMAYLSQDGQVVEMVVKVDDIDIW